MNASTPKKDVVLVVDDSPETLGMLNDTLDRAGVTVLVALEGQQALTIAASITPDVILMDAIMPNLDGFETCKRLKSIKALEHIPVIFMTGLTDTASIVKGFEAGGVDYITKPVNGDELIARMRVHLANARVTQSTKHALDSTGQYLFAATRNGQLAWATPQAHQLFDDAGLSKEWLATELPGALQEFLGSANKEGGLLLEGSVKPLDVKFISQTSGNEYLLQLIDTDRPTDVELLRAGLELTEKEAHVTLWIAHGKTNREIGFILNMSPRTVNKHLEQIFKKMDVDNRTAAAVVAVKLLNE